MPSLYHGRLEEARMTRAAACRVIYSASVTTLENRGMLLRSVRVNRAHISYLKWLLESHDGLATPTTRDGTPDIVDLLVAPDFEGELEALLDALVEEIGLERVAAPEISPL
jgi:hypothetical protein